MHSLFKRKRSAPEAGTLYLRPLRGFGDHLMLTAVLEGLRAEYPEQRVEVAGMHPELFAHNPHVAAAHSTVELNRRDPEFLALFRRIVPRPASERYLQSRIHLIDDMYGCLGVPLRERPHRPRIYLTAADEALAPEVERLPRPRIAVVPHGRPNVKLPNKVYPPEQWDAVTAGLRAAGRSVVHLGSSDDGPALPGALDLRDTGYRATAAALRRCDLLVTHVGGIMHLAAAVGTPAVVLYGAAEHPAISGYPWNRNLYVPIECGPCWMETPCSHHSCMRRLTPEIVLREIERSLAG